MLLHQKLNVAIQVNGLVWWYLRDSITPVGEYHGVKLISSAPEARSFHLNWEMLHHGLTHPSDSFSFSKALTRLISSLML